LRIGTHNVDNPASQRTNETRMDASTVAYGYDNIGQLALADSSVNTEDYGYTYDAAWNLNWRTNNGSTTAFSVNGLNELTNVGPDSAKYDANGNLTNYPNWISFSYDDENRLTSVADNVFHNYRSDFVYDGTGRLRQRLDYAWGTGTSPSGPSPLILNHWFVTNTVNYVYDGWRVIQERDVNKTPTVSYTRGLDLSGTLEGAGGIGGLLARSDGYSSGNFTSHAFYHADAGGNITCMLDANQTMVASYRYDPFGNTISKSGTLADVNTYRFSSKEIHANSGLYYYGFRWYDPNLQRWVNQDPLAEAGFQNRVHAPRAKYKVNKNLYFFVANDPIKEWDYLGLDNPGCDLPKKLMKCITPKKRNCYLQCCAEHDACYDANGCTSKSWLGKEGANCTQCNDAVVHCFASEGLSNCDKPPRWYCPNGEHKGEFYSDYSQIPADCWENGNKPPEPK
jgi:RHS repeat-associated protein